MYKKFSLLLLLLLFTFCNPKPDSDYHNGLARYYDSSEDKYGFLNTKNEIAIDAIYGKAYDFINGIAAVEYNYDWGLIDINGNNITDFKYQIIYQTEGNFYTTLLYNKEGLINSKGKEVLPNVYKKVGEVWGGRYVPVWTGSREGISSYSSTYEGMEIFDIQKSQKISIGDYQEVDTIINNVALVRTLGHREKVINLENFSSPLNNVAEGAIVELYKDNYDVLAVYYGDGVVLNKNGDTIVKGGTEDYIYNYSEGYFTLERKGTGKGFINKNNKIVVKPILEEVESFKNGKAKVTFNGVQFYINPLGECIEDCPTSGWFENFGINGGFGVKLVESVRLHSAGLDKIRQGNYWEAEKLFSQAIKENPGNAKAYADRGLANLEREYYEDAWEDLTSAVRFDSNNANYYYLLGVAHEKRGWELDAIPYFLKAVKLDPSLDDAYMKLAYIYKTKANNIKKACENLRKSCGLGNLTACNALTSFCN